jgi:hypothetical protein
LHGHSGTGCDANAERARIFQELPSSSHLPSFSEPDDFSTHYPVTTPVF